MQHKSAQQSPTNVHIYDKNGCNIQLMDTIITSHTSKAYLVERNAQGMPPHHGFGLLISLVSSVHG